MSKNSKGSGCAAIIAFVIGVGVLLAVGRFVFMGLETLALAFTHLGIEDPVSAWVGLGVVIGGLLGLVVGLRRNGRKKQWAEIGLTVVTVLLLAFAGAGAVAPRAQEPAPRAAPPPNPRCSLEP